MFLLDHADYQAWACGLESAGYASDEGYAEKLIALIERCSLFRYDHPETPPSDSVQRISRVWQINGVQVVFSRASERLEDIARLFGLDTAAIVRYNDGGYAPGLTLPVNSLVFIGEKQKRWRGSHTHHYVEESQSLFDVSQRYGIQLAALLKRNGLKPGQELFAGEQVRLRGGALFSGTNHRLGKMKAGVDSSSAKQGGD